jgi:hypothetical protein
MFINLVTSYLVHAAICATCHIHILTRVYQLVHGLPRVMLPSSTGYHAVICHVYSDTCIHYSQLPRSGHVYIHCQLGSLYNPPKVMYIDLVASYLIHAAVCATCHTHIMPRVYQLVQCHIGCPIGCHLYGHLLYTCEYVQCALDAADTLCT